MSYLEKLIDRATNTTLCLENNRIGNYTITPQHGRNLAIYHIYKDNCKPIYSKSKRRFDNQHVCTISIYDNVVDCTINNDYLTQKEITDIINVLSNIYSSFTINKLNFNN